MKQYSLEFTLVDKAKNKVIHSGFVSFPAIGRKRAVRLLCTIVGTFNALVEFWK